MQEGQAVSGQLVDDVAVERLRVAVERRGKGGQRAEADAGAAGADLADDGLDHLEQQARAVFDAAAVGAAAVIDAVAQELFEQVGVGGVDLDAVEAGGNGVARRLAVILDQAGQLVVTQGARRRHRHEAVAGEGAGLGGAGSRRHRRGAVRQQRHMRNAADVPQLQHDLATLGMHRVGDGAPGGNLLGRPDTRRVEVTLRHRRNRAGLGDDQAGARALAVILDGQRAGAVAGNGAIARQRRHHDTVGEGDVADLDGIEQGGHALLLVGYCLIRPVV
ncbi:hypothetical protein SDC9_145867 [bioreactor metagenome]|uniref:Uncharacterized protein n=1 Tax=bioreactor metagenome TaxID=1076179 RepID=A0A645EBJ4_9ZZZZ